jgi:hypothetical protein
MSPREVVVWRSLQLEVPCSPREVGERLLDDPATTPFVGVADDHAFAVRLRAARYGREPVVAAFGRMERAAEASPTPRTQVDVKLRPHALAYVGMAMHAFVFAGVFVAPALIFHVASNPTPRAIATAIGAFVVAFLAFEWMLFARDARECGRALLPRLRPVGARRLPYRTR